MKTDETILIKMNAIKKMNIDEKIELLSNEDKIYLNGYIDRALMDVTKNILRRKQK